MEAKVGGAQPNFGESMIGGGGSAFFKGQGSNRFGGRPAPSPPPHHCAQRPPLCKMFAPASARRFRPCLSIAPADCSLPFR